MNNATTTEQPIGLATIGKTTYQVFRLEVRPAQREYGVAN